LIYLSKPASVEIIIAALHEVSATPHAAPQPKALEEVEVLKEYSEQLVSKLKKRNTELQEQTGRQRFDAGLRTHVRQEPVIAGIGLLGRPGVGFFADWASRDSGSEGRVEVAWRGEG